MTCAAKYSNVSYIGTITVSVQGRKLYTDSYSSLLPTFYVQSQDMQDNFSHVRIPYYHDFPIEWKEYQLDEYDGGSLTLTGVCYSKTDLPLFKLDDSLYFDIKLRPVIGVPQGTSPETYVDFVPATTTTQIFYKAKQVGVNLSPTYYDGIFAFTGTLSYIYAERITESYTLNNVS